MPGKIVKEILHYIKSKIDGVEKIRAEKVVIGLGYTAVKLDSGHVGLCYTFSDEVNLNCCQIWRKAGSLAGSSAIKLADLSLSWDLSEAVVGVAALNALSQLAMDMELDKYVITEGNVIDQINVTKEDVVVLVGNIRSFIPKIKERTDNIFVLERNLRMRSLNVYPDTAAEELLPRASIAIITGTTLANGTIDRLLELSKNARDVVLVGPTASTLPDPLFKHGVTIIGGVRVIDSEKVIQVVSEGGGTPSLKEACKQVVIRQREGR